MSTGLLFAIGALVTVIVAIGVALPVYGAILDGRDQARFEAERRLAEVRDVAELRSGPRAVPDRGNWSA